MAAGNEIPILMAVKKAKRKQQHLLAIEEYKLWATKHPKATHQQRFDAFDRMIDSIEIAELVERLEHAPTS